MNRYLEDHLRNGKRHTRVRFHDRKPAQSWSVHAVECAAKLWHDFRFRGSAAATTESKARWPIVEIMVSDVGPGSGEAAGRWQFGRWGATTCSSHRNFPIRLAYRLPHGSCAETTRLAPTASPGLSTARAPPLGASKQPVRLSLTQEAYREPPHPDLLDRRRRVGRHPYRSLLRRGDGTEHTGTRSSRHAAAYYHALHSALR